VANEAALHNEQMQLFNEEGELLANHRYRLVAASGEEVEGVTDAEGMTERFGTDRMEIVDIELLD
jgi:uncharacterized protein (DUF2345 family)